MAWDGEGAFSRQRDDETQAYLSDFFSRAHALAGFDAYYAMLTDEERSKVVELARV